MVHLAALEAAATAQTGGGRDWREKGKVGGEGWEKGSGRQGRGERENAESSGEEAKRMHGQQAEKGWTVHKPLAVSSRLAWDRFWVTLEGSGQEGKVGGGSGGKSLLLNLAKWQHLRAM